MIHPCYLRNPLQNFQSLRLRQRLCAKRELVHSFLWCDRDSLRPSSSFLPILDDIIKFGSGAVHVYQQFPMAVSHGDIGTAVAALRVAKRLVVAAIFPKQWY